MAVSDIALFQDQRYSNWVRLRTYVTLRWIAIVGQVIAVGVAVLAYDLMIPLGPAGAAIATSALANISAAFVFPSNRRLNEREATLMLLFDLLQLGVLLFLSGGLNNPFAILILAPVTIAATVLHLCSTLLLGLVAIGITTFLGLIYVPLMTGDGITMGLPQLFLFGFWVAVLVGVGFLGLYARMITTEIHRMTEALSATQMALAREQKLTDLGGVVAAAAHELGTPLATIKLVSGELLDELGDRPDLAADVELIREQTNRCRDILRSMGRAGKDDLLMRQAPVEAVVREAAEPHTQRGKDVRVTMAPDVDDIARQPLVLRQPEIIHGLRNLIQNAVDFAQTRVAVQIGWTDDSVTLRIADDGAGFPPSVIGRIGDPFVRRRRVSETLLNRPGYDGMGMGLFIAKTLLERTGADLTFANADGSGRDGFPSGAIVTVVWDRGRIAPDAEAVQTGLGENSRFTH
jgi:two-component system sensor histidine kinase RegB